VPDTVVVVAVPSGVKVNEHDVPASKSAPADRNTRFDPTAAAPLPVTVKVVVPHPVLDTDVAAAAVRAQLGRTTVTLLPWAIAVLHVKEKVTAESLIPATGLLKLNDEAVN